MVVNDKGGNNVELRGILEELKKVSSVLPCFQKVVIISNDAGPSV